MKPPFPYYGGKQTLAARIVALLPEHGHYVEPYGGSLAVLLAKPPSMMETVNDKHLELMTFWRVLRDRPEELADACGLTPYSRAEYELCRDEPAGDDLEVARRVWVQLTQGRARLDGKTGWRFSPSPNFGMPHADALDGYVARMRAAAVRIHRVSLECRDALDIIANYGHQPGVLLYLDPPYVTSTRNSTGYLHEMSDDDHAQLAQALAETRAAVVLSGYPSPLYDELYAGWHRTDIPTQTAQGGAGKATTEVLWSNRPLAVPASLFDLDEVGAA